MSTTAQRRRTMKDRMADKIPGVSWLAMKIRAIAQIRHGRVPTGLIALLPVAVFLDFFDAADVFGGPLAMALSFFLETGFVLGLTGRTSYAFAFAGIDLIPGVDLIPFATITLVMEIRKAWNAPEADRPIDVQWRPVTP